MLWMLYSIIACMGIKNASLEDKDQKKELYFSPDEEGRFNVGYQTWEHVYVDPMGEERRINIHIWYPTLEERGEEIYYMGFIEDSEVLGAAALAETNDEQGLPLMVFSHGNFGYGANSAFLMRHFATHGWVAVAPDHAGNMVSDYTDVLPPNIRYWRPLDDSESIDAVAEAPWLSHVNTDSVLLTGHSYGAYDGWLLLGAALEQGLVDELCAEGREMSRPCTVEERAVFEQDFTDSRVKALVPMAGANSFEWFGEYGRSNVSKPVLMMSGTNDDDEPQRIWDQQETTELTWIELVGGCHQVFALGACSEMSNEDGFGITQSYALAFGRAHILGEGRMMPILSGEEELSWSEQLIFHP
jgi:predicted dienelactone hydrolase